VCNKRTVRYRATWCETALRFIEAKNDARKRVFWRWEKNCRLSYCVQTAEHVWLNRILSLIVSDMISHNSGIHTTPTKLHAIKSFATILFIQSCPSKGISQEKKARRNYFAFDHENELSYERNFSNKLHLRCRSCLFNLMSASIFLIICNFTIIF